MTLTRSSPSAGPETIERWAGLVGGLGGTSVDRDDRGLGLGFGGLGGGTLLRHDPAGRTATNERMATDCAMASGTRRFDPLSSATGRSVRQPSVQRVYQAAALARKSSSAATGCRTERPSSRRQSLNRHGDKPQVFRGFVHRCGLATRVQRVAGESGATTRRARQAQRPDDRTRARGHVPVAAELDFFASAAAW